MTIESERAYKEYAKHAQTCKICCHPTEYPFVCLIGQRLLSKFKMAVLGQKKAVSKKIH